MNNGSASATANDPDESEENTSEKSFYDTKIFRWFSLFLYIGGISGLGMILSLYYLLFFDSTMPDIHLKFPISIDGKPVQKVQSYT
ncbi:uncharacterized protein LOC105224372 [Bactrocera dorsalis]|uniref:Uncharacterized protein LOC105224372 n=1 Tax=Bactrocera dorsalis TaxID=27457 RepID=A0A6I9UT52_BACDO|nr:uncharacterized protein LOC105224372 [Bactrocera dorsalis]